jgi:type VI secretion system protein ImpL
MTGLPRRLLRSRWVRTFIGALLLAVILWFFGPLLGLGAMRPFASQLGRIIGISVIFVGWIIENLIHELRARRKEKELAEGIAKAAPDPAAVASAEEIALLSDRMKEALHALKKAKLGGRSGRYLYQLPWYMFIGPPGAGKTTALINCGLNFPLADTHGPQAVRGVGGTRNCDWWFTDQAVMIDTAGRYSTQDSDTQVDSAAWLGFLKLLKKNRGRQPLNGVLMAVSLSDLALLTESERLAHARAMRKRVRELHDELGVRIPVYVVFTKADLIAGFVEFFDNLGREDREQVWGMTLPLDDGKSEGGSVADFGREFDLLLERLNDRMLERVHQEPDVQRRRLIYGFPQQMGSLRDVANEFLIEIFRPSRLEARPLLRGVYFTSGTQDGTPIDRLLGAMANQFGLARQAITAFSGAGRSYFLARLIRQVVFGEANLVSRDPKLERRQFWTSVAAYSACALVLLILTTSWTISWLGNRDLILQEHNQATKFQQQYAALAKRGPQDTDLKAILPALETVRDMRGGYNDRPKSIPIALTFGLYQGEKLTAAAISAYTRALDGLLLPRILARLEYQMLTHLQEPDFLYESLKVYLILGRQGPLDRDLVQAWTTADFNATFPGDENADTREALANHVKAMLEYPLAQVPLDPALIARVRGILTRVPLAEYLYNRTLRSGIVQSLPDWTVADNAGPNAGRVFQLRDGKSLNTGVPGIFTWAGYHDVFLPLLPQVTKDATEDAWVLGRPQKAGMVGSVNEMNQLRRDIMGLYLDDYTRRWDAMLANIALKPFGDLSQGLDELYLLSAPDSPLRDLLEAVDQQTELSRSAVNPEAAAKAAKVGQKLGGFANYLTRAGMTLEQTQVTSILTSAFGVDAAGKPVDPAKRVDEHFKGLHEFVSGKETDVAHLETVIGKIQQVYQGMSQAANAPNQGAALLGMISGGGAGGAGGAAGGGGAAGQLQQIAQTTPKPVAAMLQTVSQSSSQVTASGASNELSDAWKSKVLPLCQEAFNRYPFIANSPQDVPLDDFTRLLGPGGLMDQFFDQYLKPFVDTTSKPWKWQSAEHTKLGLSQTSLAEFEHAAEIRDALFASGGSQILVKFQLIPEALDPGLAQITLEDGGQTLTYAHGPVQPMMMQWPGQGGNTQMRLTMTPANGGQATIIENDGPWSLLRLLDAAKVAPSGQPDKFRITFSSPEGTGVFDLNASSVRNPFSLAALRSFRCPAKL